MRKSIFLVGFRCSGKTTIGRLLAQRLGWRFLDMDEEIVEKAGKSIDKITRGGKEWKGFRQMEHDLLAKLVLVEEIVVGTGGGVLVNNVIKEGTGRSFGEINAEILSGGKNAFLVLLTCADDIIRKRMQKDEMINYESSRPILNESRAGEVGQVWADVDDRLNRKELIVNEIIKDSMKVYKARKPLYAGLTNIVIDTGINTPEEAVNLIILTYENIGKK
jgi:shikimate kinase